jgi:hypothetical protein
MLTKGDEAAAIIASLICRDETRGCTNSASLWMHPIMPRHFLDIVSGASHNTEGGVQPQSAEDTVQSWALI